LECLLTGKSSAAWTSAQFAGTQRALLAVFKPVDGLQANFVHLRLHAQPKNPAYIAIVSAMPSGV
jgi:hypothetical protein